MGRTWLRAPGTRDDSACAMARNAARSENARDPPRRRERLEIRSLDGSQAPLYFIQLSREKHGDPESKEYTPGQIYRCLKKKKIIASLNIQRNCDYAKFAPPIGAELSLRRANINFISKEREIF